MYVTIIRNFRGGAGLNNFKNGFEAEESTGKTTFLVEGVVIAPTKDSKELYDVYIVSSNYKQAEMKMLV